MQSNRIRGGGALSLLAALVLLAATARAQAPLAAPDAEPAAERLTLSETYALAAERNPRIAAAAAMADASAAKVPAAGLLPDPVFQIGAVNLALPELDADMASSMAPSMQLMQRVPFPGKLGLAERIADKTSEMASSDAGETAWTIRTAVGTAFYELYAADRQIEVMEKTLRLLEDFERVARAMYGAGTGQQSDVLRANVEIARIEADIAKKEAMRKVAAARLNGFLDRPAETAVGSPVLPELPTVVPARDTLRSWAEETRPKLEKGKTGVERADTRLDLARKELWPDFTVGLQYGQRDRGTGTERMGGAVVGFSIPIFASGRQMKLRDEAAAMRLMARADLADKRAEVDAEIGELLAELERARTLIDLYEMTVIPQAEANVESSFSSYRVGSVDFMTLVDAQTTLNRYEQEYYGLLAAYGTTVSRLETAVGRELPPTPEMLAEVR